MFSVRVDVNTERAGHADAVLVLADALSDWTDAVRQLAAADAGTDLEFQFDGRWYQVKVTTASTVRPQDVDSLTPRALDGGLIRVLIADRIPQVSREALSRLGWSWLDRRGHLRLRAPGLLVDRELLPQNDLVKTSRGRAWREVAFALLALPNDATGVRPLARSLDLSPASVSQQLQALRAADLLNRHGRALLPELFWELSGRWPVKTVPLQHEPRSGDPAGLDGFSPDLDGSAGTPGTPVGTPGWALSGTLAAVHWGAPIATSSVWPPDFLLPTPGQVSRAQRLLRPAADWASRGCTVAVTPVRQAVLQRFEPPDGQPALGTQWLLAHPVAVALDLSQDRARGREILAGWTPAGFRRVW